ncbi:MAG: enoyl-CoA hydratase/isomerase family protein [Ignavibacteriae bacterium]|nr:MAG: enoyl-CoA hydratase/isomerase family protein [Ignavibacteriota bacterium]
MSFKNILYNVSGGIAEIILNRPEKMNSLDEVLISELTGLFNQISESKDIKTVVISGAGGNFCSGLYLDYLQKISQYDIHENKADSQRFKSMLLSIYNCSKPVIAKISGYALAGGCGIATACDLIIADETAKFGYTEVKIGFIPAIVMPFLMKRVPETHAKDLLLTARIISSVEAYEIGLINKITINEDLDKEVKELCSIFSKNSASSMALTKEMFRNVPAMTFENALDYACDLNANTRMTEDFKNGIAKFLNREKK